MAVLDATIKATAAAIMQSSFFISLRHIAAIPPAFLTTDAQHIEYTDEIAEYNCAVAGIKPQGARK